MEISGKTVLVTGAAGGIGCALVAALLKADAGKVIACDLNEEALRRVEAADPRVFAQRLDVTDEAAVYQLAQQHQSVEILINCHGIVIHENYLKPNSVDLFRKEMDINFWGQVHMNRAFAPVLGRNGGGSLVNFLSPLAYVTFSFCPNYCATKAACRSLTDAMRGTLAGQGTHVMGVCPGAIDTPMMTSLDMPKSAPDIIAAAVVGGIRSGEREIWAGAGAEDLRRGLRDDPVGQADFAASLVEPPLNEQAHA